MKSCLKKQLVTTRALVRQVTNLQLLGAYVIIKAMDAILKMLIDEGYTFHLSEDEKLVIGSDPKADIIVKNNISISRKHAILELQKGALFITCFGQTGVFLNGFAIHNLERTQLQENDLIRLSESGPELLVEEIGMEKKIANEKRKKQSARIRRGFYLLFLLVSFITFVILYMDASFNLRIVELISNKNFSLSNLPFFNQLGNKEGKAEITDKQIPESWLTDQVVLTALNNQIQELAKTRGLTSVTAKRPVIDPILSPATKLANATFLLLGTDASNRIISLGAAYAVKKSGFLCTLAEYTSQAVHLYLKNEEHYFVAQLVYQDKEQGIALLRASLNMKPLFMRVINNKDIGIDVYALDLSRVTAAYIQPFSPATKTQVRSGKGQSVESPITFKKGMLSGLVHDGNNLVTDIALGANEPGGLIVDKNNAVIGIIAPPVPATKDSPAAQPAIIHVRTIADLKELNEK